MTTIDSTTSAPARAGRKRRGPAPKRTPGGFIIDKETLYPGLVLFRRADVQHRNWYCRVKLPKAERYKTFSLKTDKITEARELADDHAREIRYQIKHDIPVFDRPFLSVAREYLATQEERALRHEISVGRVPKMRSVVEQALNDYVGTTQVSKIGQELWDGYPAWRRANGRGRNARNGAREVTAELAQRLAEKGESARKRARVTRGLHPEIKPKGGGADAADKSKPVPVISDSTIRFEMSIFGAIMNYAIKKHYAPLSQRFDDRPKLKIMRRDALSLEEYRLLYETGRKWKARKDEDGKPRKPSSIWYRNVTHNFVLIMCNTGMRPSEAKNLRWGDITPAKDKDGREIAVLFVQGKGKSRKLVAPPSVLGYLNRIRAIARTKSKDAKAGLTDGQAVVVGNPSYDDFVFTTHSGEPAKSLYQSLVEDLLKEAGLRDGENGIPRSTYCFRHTYATFRLGEGVDVYFLAEQMGTSVKMIEDHYGHVNTIKHADRVLQGMGSWDPVEYPDEYDDEGATIEEANLPGSLKELAKAKKAKAAKTRSSKATAANLKAAHAAAAAKTRTSSTKPN